jgi:8-oxo-dGTP pyrophosphatase MutT (NUDIX family)
MKIVIHNEKNVKDEEVTNVVKRAKLVVENSKGELLLGHTDDSYYLIGGHVEGDESDEVCLAREIKEEAGIEYTPKLEEPFCVIKYYTRDYPHEGDISLFIANYYGVKDDLEPDYEKVELTNGEAITHLKMIYVKREDVIPELERYLDICKNKNVVLDTLEVMKDYLNNSQ